METTMYTLTANEIVVAGSAIRQASGGDRRMVYLRHPVNETAPATNGKVIDFNAWVAAQEEEARQELDCETDLYEDELFEEDVPAFETLPISTARRRRTDHSTRGMYLDWVASAAVIAVSLCASIAFFL